MQLGGRRGACIHRTLRSLTCDVLAASPLPRLRGADLAQTLFQGAVYDCVCRFDEGHRGY